MLTPLLTSVLLATIYFNKSHQMFAKGYLVFVFIVSLFFHFSMNGDLALVKETNIAITTINPTVSSKKENRPIQYVENCIDYTKTPKLVRAGISFQVIWYYVMKVVIPYPLSFYYGYSFL